MSEIKICVAGCGHWGKNLLRVFHSLGALYGMCDNFAQLARFAEQYPGAKPFSDLNQVLEDPAVHAVAIATPAELHYEMTMAALKAGKDVFVEKPIALQTDHAAAMVETARRCGRILMVGHLLKYHPAVLKAQELLAEGVLGKIEYIYSNRLNMGKVRREENALWSFAPHDISVILALTGSLPIQAAAAGGAYLQPNIADVTVSCLLFNHGVRAHIFVSWLHPYKEQRLVVIGSKSMLAFEDTRPDNKLVLFDKRIEWKNGAIEAARPQGTPVPFAAEEPLRNECAHFLECVLHRKRPRTPGEEGLQVLEVLQACQRSLQMNGQPVQVDFFSAQRLLEL